MEIDAEMDRQDYKLKEHFHQATRAKNKKAQEQAHQAQSSTKPLPNRKAAKKPNQFKRLQSLLKRQDMNREYPFEDMRPSKKQLEKNPPLNDKEREELSNLQLRLGYYDSPSDPELDPSDYIDRFHPKW